MLEHKRQGDVLLIAVDRLPEGGVEVPRVNGRIIVKAGEQTGHHHAITAPKVKMIEVRGTRYIAAEQPFDMVHEEHTVAHFEARIYMVPEQVEYTPEAIRRVLD